MSKAAEPRASASVNRVLREAETLGLDITAQRLEAGTRTAEDAARSCGCSVAQIVKSIIFREAGGERHFLFLTAGDRLVDKEKASALAGCALEKADAASVRKVTGFAIGGVSPIGHLTPIATFLDPSILGHPQVWAAAGTPNDVFAVAPDRLAAAIRPQVADFTA